MIELDDIDRQILRYLQAHGQTNAAALGRALDMPQSAIWRRVNRLETSGIIQGYHAVLDKAKLGFGVTVFLGIKLATKGRVGIREFELAAQSIPEVQLVQHVLGLYDYRLKVVARDLEDFERVLRRHIMTLPSVGNVEANVLLSEEQRPIAI